MYFIPKIIQNIQLFYQKLEKNIAKFFVPTKKSFLKTWMADQGMGF